MVIFHSYVSLPEGTEEVTKNEVPDNHPKRVWGRAQVLAVKLRSTKMY